MNNEFVLKRTGLAQSTWSEEQLRLIQLGLLEKKSNRTISGKSVCKTVAFRLSNRGRAVTFNLANISRIIGPAQATVLVRTALHNDVFANSSVRNYNLRGQSNEEFDKVILESVEVALDSFGINLIGLVKVGIQETTGVLWEEIVQRPDHLMTVLTDLFGADGAKTIETIISANIVSRFNLQMDEITGLVNLISELGQIRATVYQETASDPFILER